MGALRYVVGSRIRRSRRWARRSKYTLVREIDRRRTPTVHSACYAAHTALYFRPDGHIQACCATGFEVGSVRGPEARTLDEIWHGALLARHRAILEADSFELGCQECEVAIRSGGRPTSLASHFDRWRLHAPVEYPRLLDFALSSRCNLQCVMCNGELSSAIRTQREGRAPMPAAYDDRFFDDLAEYLPHASRVQFKGGEPFLAPENRRVWDLMIEQGSTCEVTITTNGTVWNDDVEHYMRELRAEPNVSVDGMTPEVLESIRVGTDFYGLWANIDRFQALAAEVGRPLTLSFCFMTTNWHQLPDFLDEVDRRGVSCYVILVNQPDRYDVLKLPADEVSAILDQLNASTPGLRSKRTKEEWHRVVARLRAHLDRPISWSVSTPPVEVEITRNPEPVDEVVEVPPPEPVDLDAVRDDLQQRSGNEPAEVVVRLGTVVEVHGPEWADWLQLPKWTGSTEQQMSAVLGELLESAPEVDMLSSPHERVNEVRLRWPDDAAGPPIVLWVVPVDGSDADQEYRWLLAPADHLQHTR